MSLNPGKLTAEEMSLVLNAEVLLTKNAIIKKTIELLTDLQNSLVEQSADFERSLFEVPPKISRGEQYLGLPYVVLDYPRLSSGNSLLFIRTMFWWGYFFSSTLHLAGNFRNRHSHAIVDRYQELAARQFYLGINNDPWQHHFEQENYRPIAEMTDAAFSMAVEQQSHIKLATRLPLDRWDEAGDVLTGNWRFLVGLIS
jgi:hypothetical protein